MASPDVERFRGPLGRGGDGSGEETSVGNVCCMSEGVTCGIDGCFRLLFRIGASILGQSPSGGGDGGVDLGSRGRGRALAGSERIADCMYWPYSEAVGCCARLSTVSAAGIGGTGRSGGGW